MLKTESSPVIHKPIYVSDEEEQYEDVLSRNGDTSASPPESPITLGDSTQGSFVHISSTAWPQSYRKLMDSYSSFGPPVLSNLSPSVTPLNASYLSNSYKRLVKPTDKSSPLSASFLSTKSDQEEVSLYDPALPKYASFKYTEEFHGIPRRSTTTQGTFNGINSLCGIGILTTPYALKEGGWLSLCLFLLLAVMAFYTGILLCRCLDSQPGLVTYADIGQVAFGITGRVIVSIFLCLELYGSCVEYLILEGDNISAAFPNASLNINGVQLTGKELFAVLTALCVLPTVWLRDLSLLSYISAAGVAASFLVLICVSWVGVVDGVGFHNSGPLLRLSNLPVSIGLYGYCYAGHSMFPSIYSSLSDPSKFTKIMLISFAVCTAMFGGMATMGFTMFGDETLNQITLNLPSNSVASKIGLWATIINPFTKYALNMTPVALSLEELLPSAVSSGPSYVFCLALRTALVVSSLCVALRLPFFDYILAFIGSFLSMMLCMVFPAACFLKLAGKELTLPKKALCVAIILGGSLFCIAGTYSSVVGIINSL